MPLNDDEKTALDLVLNIMESNSRRTADLTNSLMDQYQEDAKRARAELRAIRMQMTDLFDAGYMPTETAIFNALYPNPELVETLMESAWT